MVKAGAGMAVIGIADGEMIIGAMNGQPFAETGAMMTSAVTMMTAVTTGPTFAATTGAMATSTATMATMAITAATTDDAFAFRGRRGWPGRHAPPEEGQGLTPASAALAFVAAMPCLIWESTCHCRAMSVQSAADVLEEDVDASISAMRAWVRYRRSSRTSLFPKSKSGIRPTLRPGSVFFRGSKRVSQILLAE